LRQNLQSSAPIQGSVHSSKHQSQGSDTTQFRSVLDSFQSFYLIAKIMKKQFAKKKRENNFLTIKNFPKFA